MKPFYFAKLIIPIVLLLGWNCSVFAQTSTFATAGGPYTYTVPAGITTVGVDMAGGQGAGTNGGKGGRVQCNLAVSGGQILYIYVGGGASGSTGGANGGGSGGSFGGGGGSDVRTSASGSSYTNRLVVAGGGGGQGTWCNSSGDAGGAGGNTGGNGVSACGSCYGGGGATTSSGGSTPSCYGGTALNGSFGVGGSYCCNSSGGGGGGYYGGGAGYLGGGGGGSSYAPGPGTSNIVYTSGFQTSTGYVTIIGPSLTTTPSSLNFGAVAAGSTSVPPVFFGMNGTYLGAGPLTITAPANVELWNPTTSAWTAPGGSITYSYTGSTISSIGGASNIFVKFVAPSTPGSYCGNITITGGGLGTPVNVNVCGTSATACSGPVPAGTATASPTTGSSATPFTLSLAGAPLSGGLTYQWQSSASSGGPWTNIPGAIQSTYSFTGISATTYYRAIVSCPASGTSATYSGASITLATTPSYCIPTEGNTPGGNAGYNAVVGTPTYPFKIVGIGGTVLNDPTNPGSATYFNQTGTSYTATFAPGGTYSVNIGGVVSAYASGQIWIDFNNDGTFSSTEAVGGLANYYSSSSQATTSITIPSTVTPGVYRLRVQAAYSGAGYVAGQSNIYPVFPSLDPCTAGPPQNEETRDYLITIGPGPCSGIPAPGVADASTTVGCAGFTTNLFDVGASNQTGISYQWMQSPTLGSGYFPSPGASTNPVYTATVTGTGTTYYVCQVTCANGGGQALTNPMAVTLNPPPAPISGSSNICNGSTASLSSSPGGGTWSSSSSSVVTIGSSSGAATGASVGTATITYTLPSTGCYATAPVTVITAPAPISGTAVLCQSATTSLSDAVTGGTWSSSTPSVAIVGSGTGIVSAVAAGSIVTFGTINYLLPNGCSTSITVTVNPTPTLQLVSLSGSSSYCAGSPSTADIRLAGSIPGTSYQLQLGGFAVGLPLSGTGTALDFGVQTATGTYTVLGTITATGCARGMAGSQIVSVNPAPIAFPVSVTGGGVYCAGATTGIPDIILGGSQTGVTYQLYLNGFLVPGALLPGTGGILDFGAATSPGTYTVIATSTAGCTTAMTGSGIVIVNPLPTAYPVTGGGNYCAGTSGVDIGLGYSNTGISYQLYNGSFAVGGPVLGTGAALDFGLQTTNGTYTIVATNTSTGCVNNMTGTPTVFMNALPNAYPVTGGGSYCSGGTGVSIGVAPTDPGVNYQLMLGTAAVGLPQTGSGLPVSLGNQTVAGTYTVIATDPGTGCSNIMTGTATVSVNPLPTAYSVGGGGNYCAGGTGVPVTLGGSATGVTYQLLNGGSPVTTLSGTGSGLNFGMQVYSGTYTITATNNVTGCVANMTGAATVGINPLPALHNVTGTGAYCAGGTGVNVGLDFSETGVTYQLVRGGTSVGGALPGTGTPLTFGPQTVAGSYTVIATNATTACPNTMTGSAVVSINPLPSTHLVTGGGNYCAGGAGIDVGVNGSNTGINYQLYIGTSPVGGVISGTGSSLDFGNQSLAGTYTVLATDTVTGCVKNMTGGALVIVNPLPAPFTVTGGGIYCDGGTGVHIGLSSSASGVKYQLWNGGSAVGPMISGSGGPIDFGAHLATGSYTVLATNSSTLCTNNMTGSAIIATNPAPVAYSVTGGGAYCAGSSAPSIGLSSSDNNVNYQLMMGTTTIGSPVAGTTGAIDFGPQSAAGVYTVIATDAVTGCTKNMSASASVMINALPTVYNVSGGGNYCAGGTGYHVFLNLSATGVSYQLYNGTSPVGSAMSGTGAGIDFGLQTAAGSYTVVATNTTTSCNNNMAGSAAIVINSLPTAHNVTGGGGYCPGGTGSAITLDASDAGVRYQLFYGTTSVGASVTGTGSPISFGSYTGTGSYTVVGTNTATGCANNMTGTANVSLFTPPSVYSVTGGGTYCATGIGLNVGVSSSDLNVNYQLYNGVSASGVALPGTGGPVDFGRKTAPGTYSVIATDLTTGCTSNMGGSAIINVNPVVLPHVSVASSIAGTVCVGQSVTFSATPINGGTLPTFQWLVNGASAGVGSSYTYVPLNNDVVTAVIHSNATCAIPDTGSTSMTITVSAPEMPSVNVAVNPGTLVCTGAPVTFTASPMYGGTAPALVWIKNGVPAATGTTYTYVPNNHDIVTFLLGSNFNCRLADTVFSTPATMTVQDPVIPTVAVTSSAGVNVARQQSVTFTATVTHGGPAVSYQWFINSTMIPGATTATYTTSSLNDRDSVTCQVTGVCGLVGFNEIVVRVNASGVAQITTAGSDIRLVPNPNKGEFTVKGSLGTSADQEVTMEVTDMLGQVVYTGKVMTQNGSIDQHIKLNGSLANGMYLLNLRSGTENAVFHFVIEQ